MFNHKPLVWAGTAVLVILALFLLVSTNQKLNTATTTNTVTFSGQGKVIAKPDIALVDLSIVTEASSSKTAQNDNSKKSKSLTDFLKGQGVDEKDIKTTGYNIYPQYNYPQYQKPSISGYQVNQSVQVKIRDLDKVDNILDGVVTSGVNQVNQLQLTVDEPEKLRAEARDKAIKDAEDKARELTKTLDINLGHIVNFSENTGGYPVPMMYAKDSMASGMGGGGGGPSIPTGENEISVDVSITYQIK